MIALDTNLLVYGFLPGVPEHAGARRAIESASVDERGWGVTLSSIAEFWMAVTHPAAVGGPSPASAARDFLDALLDEGPGTLWMPREPFWTRLVQLAVDLDVTGPRIFDLQIALTAFDNGAVEIWTHDAGFVTFPGLRVHDPL
ncbi:MAG: PIN domain-containing protein [Acidobacteriota bacterium]|nr:PIN domain-containing protein [Acidobacteriota bacterium]MDQ5871801.1 PIN domain-containing protein [Acidobacteriota bacterium]